MINNSECRKFSTGFTAVAVAVLALYTAGCSTVRPTYMPSPVESIQLPDGSTEHRFDTDANGAIDFRERVLPKGRASLLLYDDDEDGQIDQRIQLLAGIDADSSVTSDRESANHPHLLIILDSIPFAMVADAHARGAFRHFFKPAKVISPFPVMTDLSLNEFFGVSPAMAVETDHYDGENLIDGWDLYAKEANSKWLSQVDYHRPYGQHGDAYLDPQRGFEHELAEIEKMLEQPTGRNINAYMVSTSALGFIQGENGHAWGLSKLDLFCRALVHKRRGQIDISLMSDHGHQFSSAKRVPLESDLRKKGYRVAKRLEGDGDVVIPRFGLVSCTVIHTNNPFQVARDVGAFSYVDFAACLGTDGAVEVFSDDGHAIIERRDNRYRYVCKAGDPLKLQPLIDELAANGHMDSDGFASDVVWFNATEDHLFPDPLYSLHRAFDGLVEHTPDVLVSLRRGWSYGSPFMSAFVKPLAMHGSLNAESSCGFAMTTAGTLPACLRMNDLRNELGRLLNHHVTVEGNSDETLTVAPETADRSGKDRIEPSRK